MRLVAEVVVPLLGGEIDQIMRGWRDLGRSLCLLANFVFYALSSYTPRCFFLRLAIRSMTCMMKVFSSLDLRVRLSSYYTEFIRRGQSLGMFVGISFAMQVLCQMANWLIYVRALQTTLETEIPHVSPCGDLVSRM